jgi:hypothetical protein
MGKVQYDVFNKLLSERRETLPLKLVNLSYQCIQHIRNVEYGRLCEYFSEIITILSLKVFICIYLCKGYFNDQEFGDLIDN